MTLNLNERMQTMRDWGTRTRTLPSGFKIPDIAEPVFEIGAELVPAYGAANQVVLCTHKVPANYNALITGIVLGYQGGAPIPLPADILYTVDIDRPLIAGVGSLLTAGYDEKDFGNVPIQVGSFLYGNPWPVEFRHTSGEIIRVKGSSVANVGVGAPNYLLAALVGFEWPTSRE
jgi:hypothetical protein